ncbi:MAG: rhodanese-like domain-containing protein [Bacteroidales bacterium]|nr:rhodanese-like domain-containing protein [Bacteroidales bacterium]
MFHQKNPKRLSIALIFFLAIIVIGLITIRKPDFSYKTSPGQMIESIISMEDDMTPEEAIYYVEESDPFFTFVDIRNPYDYIQGHVENSINIPLTELLSDKTFETLDQFVLDSITVILYGNNQTDANGPWMMLKQLGYNNVKVMLGGYDYYSEEPSDWEEMPEIPEYYVEDPKYDIAEILLEAASFSSASDEVDQPAAPVIPVRKKKKTVIEGGC